MNIGLNILRYSLFGIAGGQEVDHTFVKFITYSLTMSALLSNSNYSRKSLVLFVGCPLITPKKQCLNNLFLSNIFAASYIQIKT